MIYISILIGIQPLQHNSYTEPFWKAAVAQYERSLAPAELRIAGKLRGKFQRLQAQPHQLLREFQRYRELVKRPNISKELTSERYPSYKVGEILIRSIITIHAVHHFFISPHKWLNYFFMSSPKSAVYLILVVCM